MSVELILLIGLGFTVVGLIFVITTARRTGEAWRDWRVRMRTPLIDSTDPRVHDTEPRWHLSSRWPNPFPETEMPMDVSLARAYARLARARSRSVRTYAEVILLVAAAILGVQMPNLLGYLAEGMLTDRLNTTAETLSLVGQILTCLPVVVMIMVAVHLRELAEDYDIGRGRYERVQLRTLQEANGDGMRLRDVPTPSSEQQKSWWLRLFTHSRPSG